MVTLLLDYTHAADPYAALRGETGDVLGNVLLLDSQHANSCTAFRGATQAVLGEVLLLDFQHATGTLLTHCCFLCREQSSPAASVFLEGRWFPAQEPEQPDLASSIINIDPRVDQVNFTHHQR